LKDGVTFDLNSSSSKKVWDWVKYKEVVALNVEDLRSSPKARYFVYEENKEDVKEVTKYELKIKAGNLVANDTDEEVRFKAPLITGANMEGFTIQQIRKFLYQYAEKNPHKVISVYGDPDLGRRKFIKDAIDKRIINMRDGAYFYVDTILSTTEEGILAWLKKPENTAKIRVIEKLMYPDLDINSFDVEDFQSTPTPTVADAFTLTAPKNTKFQKKS
jgi:hypothetical protein